MLLLRRSLLVLALFAVLTCAWYSVLFARADISASENNLAGSRTAVVLVPGNAAYHAYLAEYLEAAGGSPDEELRIATSLHPSESRYWIRRGFRAELEQKYD